MGEVAVLSIGTTHPWNIAGVGLDLRIGAQLGARVFTVLAAISAQDAAGVRALEPLSPATVRAQLEAVPWQLVDAVRVGALGSPDAVHTVAAALAGRDLPVVVDPVVFATGGSALAGEGTLQAIGAELLTLPQVVLTPNLDEAGTLLGREIGRAQLVDAAVELRSRGARAVLLKGGHLAGEPSDVLADRDGVETFSGQRIQAEMRGTGCTLAMALAVALGRGDALRDAVRFARAFVRDRITHAVQVDGMRAAY
jgi:hydroxymethylpyrimidine kinase/phosphomethylpyrimidine kinase